MQRPSVFSSRSSFHPLSLIPSSLGLITVSLNPLKHSVDSLSWPKLSSKSLQIYSHAYSPLHSTATEETVQTSKCESELIEIGYICNVHGLQGEVRVKPNTGFPELRFSKGRRWLKERISGKERIREVELVDGRGHPGQKSWIVRLSGIDTVDEAKQLVGSTLLVREEDRPVLEEGEFYTPDLVGMRVVLKDTSELVGTVVNVYNSGASDLLQVMLNSFQENIDGTGLSKSETDPSGHVVWVPFVESIVPVVDIERREMQITPPKGLLELNIRSDGRSKKERRRLEWKQRKKFQQRLIAAKKKLCEMEQQHVFHGFRFGEKAQGSLLADQIVGTNSKLLQQAMQSIKLPTCRWNRSEFFNTNDTKLLQNHLKVSKKCLEFDPCGNEWKLERHTEFQQKGLNLILEGKFAVILVVDGNQNQERASESHLVASESIENSSHSLLQALLCDDKRFPKMERRDSLTLIMVCPAQDVQPLQTIFSNHDYFGFSAEKVWFLPEETLPVVSSSAENQKWHKILMKSPWEILHSPVGSGGVFSLLSSHKVLENLSEIGVELVQVCRFHQQSLVGYPIFSGFVNSLDADIGFRIFDNLDDVEEDFDMIFSMRFLNKMTKQIDKLQFHAVAKQYSYVEKVDKEWVEVVPSSPNSYEFHSSIYSSLNALTSEKFCVLELTD